MSSTDCTKFAKSADVYQRGEVDTLLADLQASQLTQAQVDAIVAAIPQTPVTAADVAVIQGSIQNLGAQVAEKADQTELASTQAEVADIYTRIPVPESWMNCKTLDLGQTGFKARCETVGDTRLLRVTGFITGTIAEGRWTNAVMIYSPSAPLAGNHIPQSSLRYQTVIAPTNHQSRLAYVRLRPGSDGTTPVIDVRPVDAPAPAAPVTSISLHGVLFDLTNVDGAPSYQNPP